MKRIALINQKGGTGKTTTAINAGAGLAAMGKSVLLIDLDPQANLTQSVGIRSQGLTRTVYELLKGETTIEAAAIKRGGLKVIPSTLDLSGAEIELSATAGREVLLREALDGLKGFDYILIDCPPSLGLLSLNALTTAQEVYIPMQTEYLALQGLSRLIEVVEIVRKRLNRGLEISGIIATRFDSRKNLNREVVEKIRGYFGSKVFKTVIRDNIALAEAPSYAQTIFEYAPRSYGAEDYLSLCKEIIKRG